MNSNSTPLYIPLTIRGKGIFGTVLELYDAINDKRVAIKRIHKITKNLGREIEILMKLKDSAHIVKLLDIFFSINNDGLLVQNIVLEYCPLNLENYIKNIKKEQKFIPIKEIKIIFKQICLGLNYCHKLKIVHRDLKPDNILISQNNCIKLSDFGSAKIIDKETLSNPHAVSRYYRAPELILGENKYDEKIDIFSAGCILAELFMLEPLFPGKTEAMQLFEYMTVLGYPGNSYFNKFNLPKKINDKIKSIEIKKMDLSSILNKNNYYDIKDIEDAEYLILDMLNFDPKKRPSASLCTKYNFLLNIKVNNSDL